MSADVMSQRRVASALLCMPPECFEDGRPQEHASPEETGVHQVDYLLLTSMAYDRYVAICIPMRYSLIMQKYICLLLAFVPWIIGATSASMFSWLVSNLSFCDHQEISHFFCELKAILELSCSGTGNIKIALIVVCIAFGLIPFGLILISYGNIIYSVSKIRTSAGKLKTFSSCCSHLTVVVLFCGTCLCLYMKPDSGNPQEMDKLLSLLYVARERLNFKVCQNARRECVTSEKRWRNLNEERQEQVEYE
ncbi:putative olfactory receptor 2B3 [Xenopus tropicalis]|uniref:Olfactory receptor 2B3 n=1 Tax=Xenopus tropicalis TaxID=8364 RepID=A0A8J1J899_XENTR|nr:putative olfactory receptor 2B3 [Xenopus tropicalis]